MTGKEMLAAINAPKECRKICDEFQAVGAEYAALKNVINSQPDYRANDAQYKKQCELKARLVRLTRALGPEYYLNEYSGGIRMEAPDAYDDTWVITWS
jgi:hypothetical protein